MAESSIETGKQRVKKRAIAVSVNVPAEAMSYPVLIGRGLLERLGSEVKRSSHGVRKVALVSDENVMPLYGAQAITSLEAESIEVSVFTVPPGEASKTPAQAVQLVESFVDAGLGRHDVVVALGGGVVGDLAGFAAATFMRGIAFVQCPTTLLAQVDASVGGKVAVDLPGGKNLMGAFHFPTAVIADPEVLKTLSQRELSCGMAEMLKHGALFSVEHFERVQASASAIFDEAEQVSASLVGASVALKAACVSRDPHERGEAGKGRVVLNLGHTVGHALELLSGYEIAHGEAVGLGLRAAARLSERRGLCAEGLEAVMTDALRALHLPLDLDAYLARYDDRQLTRAIHADKKRSKEAVSYVALEAIGRPSTLALRPSEIVGILREGA